MMNKFDYRCIFAALSAVGGVIAQMVGGFDKLAAVLAVVMATDYLTGILCALVWHASPKSATGAFDSRAGLKGLFRKAAILLVVMMATALSSMLGTTVLRDTTILFFICNESFSCIENFGLMGVPFPPAVRAALEALRDKAEKGTTIESDYMPLHDKQQDDLNIRPDPDEDYYNDFLDSGE